MRVFVDASVLFSAVISQAGASRELLRYAVMEQVILVVSPYVLAEVEANLAKKAPLNASRFDQISAIVNFEVVQPDRAAVLAAAQYTVLKDAPVVAAAIVSDCTYLATFDRKHLIDPPEVTEKSGLKVVTPAIVLDAIRQQLDEGNSDS